MKYFYFLLSFLVGSYFGSVAYAQVKISSDVKPLEVKEFSVDDFSKVEKGQKQSFLDKMRIQRKNNIELLNAMRFDTNEDYLKNKELTRSNAK